MKKCWYFTLLAALFTISACGAGEEDHTTETIDELAPIEVELSVPDTAEKGEPVTFSSEVFHGEDLVEDANEVVYEIWLEGQKENSELIEAEQDGHVYLLEHVFNEGGLYHVQVHVTARGLHRMPTAQIRIGDVGEGEQKHKHKHEKEHEHDHQHQHANVHVDTALEQERLVMEIRVEGTPFRGGRVTLEMRKNNEESPQWLELTEVNPGEYQLLNSNKFTGSYHAIVHIEDEHLHEHVDIEIEF
jgi:hypothetical protein